MINIANQTILALYYGVGEATDTYTIGYNATSITKDVDEDGKNLYIIKLTDNITIIQYANEYVTLKLEK